MESPFKVERRIVKGASGVKHEVDIVECNGKRYILIDGGKLSEDELRIELAKKIIISIDTNIPPLIINNNMENPLKEIENIIKELKGKIIHRTLN